MKTTTRETTMEELKRICTYIQSRLNDYDLVKYFYSVLSHAKERSAGLYEDEVTFDKHGNFKSLMIRTYDGTCYIGVHDKDEDYLQVSIGIDDDFYKWDADKILMQRPLKDWELKQIIYFLTWDADYVEVKLMKLTQPTESQLVEIEKTIGDEETKSWVEFDQTVERMGLIKNLKIWNDKKGYSLSIDKDGFLGGYTDGDNSAPFYHHGKGFTTKIKNIDTIELV